MIYEGHLGMGSPRSWRIFYHLKVFAWVGNTDAANCNVFSNFYTHTHTHTHTDPPPFFLFYEQDKNNWVEIRKEIFLWIKCSGIQGNEHALRCLSISVNSFCLRLNTHTHTCVCTFFKAIRSIGLIALEMPYWFLKCSKSLKIRVKKTLSWHNTFAKPAILSFFAQSQLLYPLHPSNLEHPLSKAVVPLEWGHMDPWILCSISNL